MCVESKPEAMPELAQPMMSMPPIPLTDVTADEEEDEEKQATILPLPAAEPRSVGRMSFPY